MYLVLEMQAGDRLRAVIDKAYRIAVMLEISVKFVHNEIPYCISPSLCVSDDIYKAYCEERDKAQKNLDKEKENNATRINGDSR
jgi:hypothetical protein